MRTVLIAVLIAVLLALTGCAAESGRAPDPTAPDGPPTTTRSDLLPSSMFLVALTDGRILAVYRGRAHPRGGYPLHVFTRDGEGRVVEVRYGGRPLLPFVATDTVAAAMTATCARDGEVAVTTATVHEPPGIILAWDVTRTTYRLHGARAEKVATTSVGRSVADPVLRRRMPALFHPGEIFADCRTGVQ